MGTLRKGDLVEVRSKEEVLSTLDNDGLLDGLPFMPEMLTYCGQRYRVGAVAHKTCDTVGKTGGRRLESAVHLEDLRCDGSAHGGCEADCLMFWKEAWLRPVEPARAQRASAMTSRAGGCSEAQLRAAVYAHGSTGSIDPIYVCQATRLPLYTEPLPWWDVRQYAHDVTSRNHPLAHALRVLFLACVRKLLRLPLGFRAFRAIYNTLHAFLTGRQSPYVDGAISKGSQTPHGTLDLQPGDLVRVKSLEEIGRTLDIENKNRGLAFDAEMARYSHHTFRVRRRINRIVNEQTGRLIRTKFPCITLEEVVCTAEYSQCRLMCPRALPSYWRELWLERVEPETEAGFL